MNDELDLMLYADPAELVDAASTEAMEVISSHLLDKGVCHIALTGGTLGTEFAHSLVARINDLADLSGLNIWFSDERFVPADSPFRNSRVVIEGLQNSSVKVHAVETSEGGLTVQEAAEKYELELGEFEMDICVLGLGPDGHVASLFPQRWESTQENSKTGKVIAVEDAPKPPPKRNSFSMSFINSSTEVWILAAGEEKASAVTQLLEADPSVPAGHIKASQLTRLFIDTEAFFSQ